MWLAEHARQSDDERLKGLAQHGIVMFKLFLRFCVRFQLCTQGCRLIQLILLHLL
jgi:hypothetical protein